MEVLGPYLVEFRDDGSMEEKVYPSDCAVNRPNKKPVILIIYDESTFMANDGQDQAWLKKGDTFLRPKGREKDIMVSDFLLPWKHLNLFYLKSNKQKAFISFDISKKAAKIFEYSQEDRLLKWSKGCQSNLRISFTNCSSLISLISYHFYV